MLSLGTTSICSAVGPLLAYFPSQGWRSIKVIIFTALGTFSSKMLLYYSVWWWRKQGVLLAPWFMLRHQQRWGWGERWWGETKVMGRKRITSWNNYICTLCWICMFTRDTHTHIHIYRHTFKACLAQEKPSVMLDVVMVSIILCSLIILPTPSFQQVFLGN